MVEYMMTDAGYTTPGFARIGNQLNYSSSDDEAMMFRGLDALVMIGSFLAE
jgi:hypothetical protein